MTKQELLKKKQNKKTFESLFSFSADAHAQSAAIRCSVNSKTIPSKNFETNHFYFSANYLVIEVTMKELRSNI